MAKCSVCSLDSTFALCVHGACAACRISGSCSLCEAAAALEMQRVFLPPAIAQAWQTAFATALDEGIDYSEAREFAWATVRTDFNIPRFCTDSPKL